MKASVLKKLVIVFNFIIFVCGAAILGIGIWSVVANVDIFTLVDEKMLGGVYVLIVSGAIVMLISFLGCYGCMNDSKPAICVYSVVTMLVAIMKTIACIFLYVYYVEAEDLLRSTFKEQYGVEMNSTVTRAWDQTQTLGECCGLRDYRDWETSYYFNTTNTYPASCCVPSPEIESIPLDRESCNVPLDGFIYISGCDYFLRVFYYAIGCTGIVVILCELAAVVFIVAYYQWIP